MKLSVSQEIKNCGCDKSEALMVADFVGMDLKSLVDAGNFEDAYYQYRQESNWLMQEAKEEFANYTDKDYEALGLVKDLEGNWTLAREIQK